MIKRAIVGVACTAAIAIGGLRACLLAHADAPTGQFSISSDGLTVLDNKTGLRWQRNVDATRYGWLDAMTHCAVLNVAGLYGWRLPTFKELATLIDDRH